MKPRPEPPADPQRVPQRDPQLSRRFRLLREGENWAVDSSARTPGSTAVVPIYGSIGTVVPASQVTGIA